MNKHSIALNAVVKIYCFLFLVHLQLPSTGQPVTQSIRGLISNIESQSPLANASITLLSTLHPMGAISQEDGSFRIDRVPVGRHTLLISLNGYENATLTEVLVTSGKETILPVFLKQVVTKLKEVVIKSGIQKHRPLNAMATVSARSFSVEETRRYAGGLDDPARMASAFAGVTAGNLQDNAIIIRGNAPKGVLWRLEGVEIPNPNHFAGGNVAGGGVVTIFSSQLLSNSDFFTGAFPAEYGNALAGVFDMKLRSGNNEKRESAIQLGLMGIDLSSEGPFKKGKKATYLFNYRYSTLALLSAMGLFKEAQLPKYQDFSFKVNLPTQKAGTFSLWGIGALDHAFEKPALDSGKWETNWDRFQNNWKLSTGALGLTHKLNLGTQTLLTTTLATAGVKNTADMRRVNDDLQLQPDARLTDLSGRATLSSVLNHTFKPGLSIRTGINYHCLFYNLDLNSTIDNDPASFRNITRSSGESGFMEFFAQSRYSITSNFTLNAGINASYYDINKTSAVDPRIGLQYKINHRQTLAFGYGRHRQMEDLRIYMIEQKREDKVSYPNKQLQLANAQHFVLAYDWQLTPSLRLKLEPYYQVLQNIPGIADSSYSMVNFQQDWTFSDSLGNNSRGRNMGIDLTLERFLRNNYYYLITGSIFNSRYKAADGIWRNTRYNKTFAFNVLGGKEWITPKGDIWGFNGRLNVLGGQRYSPVDVDKTLANKKIYYDEQHAFEKQADPMYYFDLTITYRINRKKYSGIFALQLKNVFGTPSFYGYDYNYRSREIVKEVDRIMLPILSYKIEF